ncbi:hypothetical protein [Ahniella affigens]|nr:hypothetical protein [Ahniella affigens]
MQRSNRVWLLLTILGGAVFVFLVGFFTGKLLEPFENWLNGLRPVQAIFAFANAVYWPLAFYVASVLLAYELGAKEKGSRPTFELVSLVHYKNSDGAFCNLLVANHGAPASNFRVKVLGLHRVHDGFQPNLAGAFPFALMTHARGGVQPLASFHLGSGESTQVALCRIDFALNALVIDPQVGVPITIFDSSAEGYAVTVGLFGDTSSERAIVLEIKGRTIDARILSESEFGSMKARWSRIADSKKL